jgi:hypothetical protein
VIPHGVEIFVGLEPIDLRWSFDRLAGIVTERIGHNVRSHALHRIARMAGNGAVRRATFEKMIASAEATGAWFTVLLGVLDELANLDTAAVLVAAGRVPTETDEDGAAAAWPRYLSLRGNLRDLGAPTPLITRLLSRSARGGQSRSAGGGPGRNSDRHCDWGRKWTQGGGRRTSRRREARPAARHPTEQGRDMGRSERRGVAGI